MNRLGQLVDLHLAITVFIGSRFILQRGHPMFLEAIHPGADGAPGKLITLTGQHIIKRFGGDLLDAFPEVIARGLLDGV